MTGAPRVMLLIEASRGYERALLRGIARYSHLHGPWIFLREAPFWEREPHRALIEQLKSVDGIIMRECADMPQILRLGKPVIVSNYATEQIPGLPNIISDHMAIGRMAAEHLIERGFRHFAFCGYSSFFWSNQRRHGFEQRIKKAGVKVHLYDSAEGGRQMHWKKELLRVAKWLQSLPKPVGIMACIDERSQQVAEACKAAGLSIPDQVSIVGVDNDEMICTLSGIPLSSVAINAEKGGYEAAEQLDSLMKGKKKYRKSIKIKPSRVVARTSTDIVAVEDLNVSRAAKYIMDNCRQTIYVADVAKAAGLSRRVLEKRFRRTLNRSINEHIRQCKVSMITELLTGSNMTISEIALHMGFPDAAHIARYFRSQTGTSPADYRRRHMV